MMDLDLRGLVNDPAPDGAFCAYHPRVEARRICQRCGSFICEVCRSAGNFETTTCVTCARRPEPVVVRGQRIVLVIVVGQMLLIFGTVPFVTLRVALFKVTVNAFLCWHAYHGEPAARAIFIALLAAAAIARTYAGITGMWDGLFVAVAIAFALGLSFSPSVNAFFRTSQR